MTKCHLISLSGQGDVHTILVNDVSWEYLMYAGDGRAIPDEVIADFVAHQREQGDNENSNSNLEVMARRCLSWNSRSGSADNDIAMSMGGSSFGGERWNNYGSRDLKEMMKFISKHGLELDGEFEGAIY